MYRYRWYVKLLSTLTRFALLVTHEFFILATAEQTRKQAAKLQHLLLERRASWREWNNDDC